MCCEIKQLAGANQRDFPTRMERIIVSVAVYEHKC